MSNCCPSTVVVVPGSGGGADGVVTAGVVGGGNITLTRSIGGNVVFALGSIDENSDVDTTTTPPSNGEALIWNGSNWVPGAVSTTDEFVNGGSVTGGNIVLTRAIGADVTFSLGSIDEHSDVDTTTTPPVDGNVLTWVAANSAWEPAAGGGGASGRRPWVEIGQAQATSADDVLETDDIWHSGKVVVGTNVFNGTATQVEVLGNVMFGANTNEITAGTNCSVLGGASNTLSGGNNNVIVAGISNTVDAANDFSAILCGTTNQVNPLSVAALHSMVIAGGNNNVVEGISAGVLAGGANSVDGNQSVIVGGSSNSIIASSNSFVGGGLNNTISAISGAYILGGSNNDIGSLNAQFSFIGGGSGNDIITSAGQSNVICGGDDNEINFGARNFIGAGQDILVRGNDCVALGQAITYTGLPTGAFAYNGDATLLTIAGTSNVFVAKAAGGVTFYSDTGATTGVNLAASASAWAGVSSRTRKTDLVPVDTESIASKLRNLPVYTGKFIKQDNEDRRLFVIAEDWDDNFGDVVANVRIDNNGGGQVPGINSMDLDVATIGAMQYALQKIEEQAEIIASLETRISLLEL